MIKTGILSASNSRMKMVELIQEVNELKITNLSLDTDTSSDSSVVLKAEEMMDTSDVLFIDIPSPGYKLLKMIIRNSNHFFSCAIPSLSAEEIKNLIMLEREAGCTTQFFSPHIFTDENLKLLSKYKNPALINVRYKADKRENIEKELQNVILYLVLLDKSEFKKVDLMSLEGENNSFVLDMRLSFSSGTIARLLFSSHLDDDSVVEIFQHNQPVITSHLSIPDEVKQYKSEKNAIKHFIKAIKNQPATTIALSELLTTNNILEEIKDKLKSRGSLLLS